MLSCLLIAGCQESAAPPTVSQIHLKQLSVLFGQYTSSHKGQGPVSETAFKAFIKKRSASLTDDQLAALFVSPRDQQPYVIVYKARLGAMPQTAPIVAHEATGVAGKRMAADVLGGVQEVEEAELEERLLKP